MSLSPKPRDKHNKLRETIEKLKAKSEIKLRDEFEFELDLPKENKDKNKRQEKESDDKTTVKVKNKSFNNRISKSDPYLELEGNNTIDSNISDCKNSKKFVPKNSISIAKPSNLDALTIATEQTLKDINKWLDDTPKFSEFSSASNSPSYTGCEDLETVSGKVDPNTAKKPEKPAGIKKEVGVKDHKKRSVRDTSKFFKKREVQRTFDRLQPGKSKGNLISNVQNSNKSDELFLSGPLSKIKDTKNSLIVKTDTNAPKLSLGSVLDSFGKHNFIDDQKKEEQKILAEIPKENASPNSKDIDRQENEVVDISNKVDKEDKVENESTVDDAISGGGATPNLSAWFKAFGAPKVQPVQKKTDLKPDGKENERLEENSNKMTKVPVPIVSPNTESPIISHGQPIPRQRKISTGSSMSERSSFSQDMDSPRVGMDERGAYPAPYPSPLHRSPSGTSPLMASPRPDISPKSTAYPTINGQIRCGFYQDTVSNKSSPDKSCSPKENPQSPYPHYSEHVYSPNNENTYYSYANSPYYTHAPNYSSTNPTPPYNMEGSGSYYDTSKSLTEQYQAKNAHCYNANSPASNQSSPAHPQHSPNLVLSPHSPNIHSQHSPNISQHSPNVHLQHSPTFLSQHSPHPQPSPGFHSQHSPVLHPPHSPVHSPNLLSHDAPISPVQCQMTSNVQSSPNLQIQNSSSVHSVPSPKIQTNPSEPEIFTKEDQSEGVDNALQQTGLQSAIFPVKKRTYNDNDLSQINNQRYELEVKTTQKQAPILLDDPLNLPTTLEKNYKSFSDQSDSNKCLNLDTSETLIGRNTSSPISQLSSQTLDETTNNIFSGTKLANSYALSYGRENNCPLNIPNTRSITVTQPNTVEMSKYTNMGYTGPEENYNKSAQQFSHTETSLVNSSPVVTSHKPSTPMQVTSTVTQPLSQPMDISRFCSSNISVSQRHKTVEANTNHPTPQQAHSNFTSTSRTADLQSQNLPCGYKSDVTVPRPTYNTPAIDVEQPLGLGRNMSSFSHLVDRYSNDERLLAGLQSSSTFYTDKGLGTSQLFNKPISTNTSTLPMYSQADMAAMQQCYSQSIQGSPSIYNRPIAEIQNSNSLQSDQKTNLQIQGQEKKKKKKNSKLGKYESYFRNIKFIWVLYD